MRRGDYGRIVNVSSIAGQVARAGDVLYPATKGGLDALTRAMAADLGRHGVTVNAIAPGYFATEPNQAMVEDESVAEWLRQRTSLGRWGQPQEVAGAVVFLLRRPHPMSPGRCWPWTAAISGTSEALPAAKRTQFCVPLLAGSQRRAGGLPPR